MQQSIVQQLRALNASFYEKVALAFSETRSQAWEGWDGLLPKLQSVLEKPGAHILDLGCGNGRFYEFLRKNFPARGWQYTGIDSNETLLEIARKKNTAQFAHGDVLEGWTGQYSVITAFGVVHHIPSFDLRLQFFQHITQSLKEDGLAIISIWQFNEIPSLMKSAVLPEEIGISPTKLEKNDYFLLWQRETPAVRYCHLVDSAEELALLEKSGLEKIDEFFADGKNHHTNHYLILRAKTAANNGNS